MTTIKIYKMKFKQPVIEIEREIDFEYTETEAIDDLVKYLQHENYEDFLDYLYEEQYIVRRHLIGDNLDLDYIFSIEEEGIENFKNEWIMRARFLSKITEHINLNKHKKYIIEIENC